MKILSISLSFLFLAYSTEAKWFLMPYPISRSWEAAADLQDLVIKQDVEGDYVVGASYQVGPTNPQYKVVKPRGIVLDAVPKPNTGKDFFLKTSWYPNKGSSGF